MPGKHGHPHVQSLWTALDLGDGSLVLWALSGITHTGRAEGWVLVLPAALRGTVLWGPALAEALLVESLSTAAQAKASRWVIYPGGKKGDKLQSQQLYKANNSANIHIGTKYLLLWMVETIMFSILRLYSFSDYEVCFSSGTFLIQ